MGLDTIPDSPTIHGTDSNTDSIADIDNSTDSFAYSIDLASFYLWSISTLFTGGWSGIHPAVSFEFLILARASGSGQASSGGIGPVKGGPDLIAGLAASILLLASSCIPLTSSP